MEFGRVVFEICQRTTGKLVSRHFVTRRGYIDVTDMLIYVYQTANSCTALQTFTFAKEIMFCLRLFVCLLVDWSTGRMTQKNYGLIFLKFGIRVGNNKVDL